MNRTGIPGFTAEASLYRTRGRYLAAGQAAGSHERTSVRPAMMDDGSIDCSNCLGGECVELHCFENWTQGGGGPGGPYEGGGGGGGFGGGGGGGGTLRGCRDSAGRTRRHGTTVTTTVQGPGGGVEDQYVIRQRCSNGAWVDMPF